MYILEMFEFDGWDQVDTFAYGFYDCVVKIPFHTYNVGDKIPVIAINYEQGTIETRRDGETVNGFTPTITEWTAKINTTFTTI